MGVPARMFIVRACVGDYLGIWTMDKAVSLSDSPLGVGGHIGELVGSVCTTKLVASHSVVNPLLILEVMRELGRDSVLPVLIRQEHEGRN